MYTTTKSDSPTWPLPTTTISPYSTKPLPLILPWFHLPPLCLPFCLFMTHDHHDTCWTHCTSLGSCWWSFSCFSLLESSIWNADGSPKGLCWVNTTVQVVVKTPNIKPNGRAPTLKTWVGCLHFTFTIAGSHIGWALTKNGEHAVDRMNWLRPFSLSFTSLRSHQYLPEKGSDWSTCFSVHLQVLCARRVGLVTRYGGQGGELRH